MQKHTLLIALIAITACGGDGAETDQPDTNTAEAGAPSAAAADSAVAQLRNAAGADLGTIVLKDADGGVSLAGTVRGLPPGGHGFHLHMTGSCQAPFESAGGHWNPDGKKHGFLSPQGPHRGDLPNLTVTADSTGLVQGVTQGGKLRGADGLLDADGAAIVVHAKEDDDTTDPSGNSGERIACGVIS